MGREPEAAREPVTLDPQGASRLIWGKSDGKNEGGDDEQKPLLHIRTNTDCLSVT